LGWDYNLFFVIAKQISTKIMKYKYMILYDNAFYNELILADFIPEGKIDIYDLIQVSDINQCDNHCKNLFKSNMMAEIPLPLIIQPSLN